MIKYYLKLAAVAVLVLTTFGLLIFELRTKGTMTGLTLLPLLIGLIWSGGSMIKSDIKDLTRIYWEADDE